MTDNLDSTIRVLNRLRGLLHGKGMLTATPEEFAKKTNVPVAEWRECVTRLRANKRVACNLERPDRRGRVTIWIQRALKDQRQPRDLAATEDTRTLGEALGNALNPPKAQPDAEFWGEQGKIDPANPPDLEAVPSPASSDDDEP